MTRVCNIVISIIVDISLDLSQLPKLCSEHVTPCYDSICGLLDQSASGITDRSQI